MHNRPVKVLRIEMLQGVPTPITEIPEKYHNLTIRHAKVYYESDHDCDIISQRIRLFGMSIWIHDVIARNDIVLSPVTPRHILVAHIMLQDSVVAVLQSDVAFDLKEEEGNFFSLLAEAQVAEMNAGQRFRSFHINIYPEDLPELALQFPVLAHLAGKEIPVESAPLNFSPFRITPACELLRKGVEKCQYLGVQADCFLTRIAVDLLANFIRQDEQAGPAPDIIDKKAAERTFRLINNYYDLPLSIHLMASRLSVPRIALHESFLHVYGVSITDHLRTVRMMKAYDLMVSTALTLKDIAKDTGFPTEEMLTAAFTEYYGQDPISLRNAQ